MNNRKTYKDAMSGVHHSDDAIERIFDMTVDNKKKGSFQLLKRLASAALALAVIAGGGFGVNSIVHKDENGTESSTSSQLSVTTSSTGSQLSVMVAYAAERYIKAGSENEQEIFYSLHYADINDEESIKKAEALHDKDYCEVMAKAEELGEQGYTACVGGGSGDCWSDKRYEDTARLFRVRGGSIALDLDDYSNVKAITIENSCKYGCLYFQYYKDDDFKSVLTDNDEGKVFISGDELRYSKDSGWFEGGTTHKVNKGYSLNWNPSDALYKAIADDLSFDLSQIKDTITFTVEFNDGDVKTASLDLYFDSDGYMHF